MLQEGVALSVFGDEFTVGSMLGQGGEGAVFAVLDRVGRPRYALKWYHSHTAHPHRWESLNDLVDRGAPDRSFLWPLAVIAADDDASRFGYVMHFRPEEYCGMADLLGGRVGRTDRAVARAAFDLASGFSALHTAGLCYRDVNFGNVFLRPSDGRVLICDNDNVGVDDGTGASVAGTPKFMAPEVVRGEAPPSIATDQFSLAVLLFYLLMVGHPLEGVLTEGVLADDEAHVRFHGTHPRFCFDPDDDSNRPHPEFHAHVAQLWHALPASIRELFVRSFTTGVGEPSQRVRDSEWCAALLRLRDSVVVCRGCGDEQFVDADRVGAPCPWCDHQPDSMVGMRLTTGPVVVAAEGAEVTRHHLAFDFDLESVIGRVELRPGTADVLGLRNVSDGPWRYLVDDGDASELPPERTVRLVPGLRVELGDAVELVVERLR